MAGTFSAVALAERPLHRMARVAKSFEPARQGSCAHGHGVKHPVAVLLSSETQRHTVEDVTEDRLFDCELLVPALKPSSASAEEGREGAAQRRCTLSSSSAVLLIRFAATCAASA